MLKINRKLNKINKLAIISLSFSVLVIILVFGLKIAFAAWQEPSLPPPQGNTSQLIDIGPDDQAKAGYLRLDPTFDTNNLPPTDIKHILEVRGDGAKISTLNVDGNLAVDIDTLYVNSNTQRVGIGTTNPVSKLTIEGSTGLLVGNKAAAVSGQAIKASTSGADSHGVYGSSTAVNYAGVYGESKSVCSGGSNNGNACSSNNDCPDGVCLYGYGVWGESGSCAGVYGTSSIAGGTGLKAETTSGPYALYAKNNTAAGSYWAGYFQGRLEATDEVIGSKFLPTQLQNSLVPYTTGWEVGSYTAAEHPDYLAFDGTYIWTANSDDITRAGPNISKIRASDGKKVFDVNLPELGGVKPLPLDITFDGSYIWVSYRYGLNDGYISKLDSSTGNTIGTAFSFTYRPNRIISTFDGTNSYIWASSSTGRVVRIKISDGTTCTYSTGLSNPQGLAFDGTNVWMADFGTNKMYQFDHNPNNCNPVGNAIDFGADSHPINIVFDGSSLWVTLMMSGGKCVNNGNSCTNDSECPGSTCFIGKDNLAKVSLDRNTTNYPVNYYSTGTENAFNLAFDGTYLWVDHQGHGHLRRVLAADGSSNFVDYDLTGTIADHTGIIFDGTYLWIGHGEYDNKITKFYTGTGWGHTDLSSLVNLQTSTPGTAQTGSFSTSGTATIDTNLEVGGDLAVTNNVWGDSSDESVGIVDNKADCSTSGYFIKGIETDASGNLTKILCRPL